LTNVSSTPSEGSVTNFGIDVKIRSLRFRLSWINGVVVAAAFLCVGFARYITVSYRAYMRFDADLQHDAAFLSSHLSVSSNALRLRLEGMSADEVINLQEIQHDSVVSDAAGRVPNPEACSRPMQQMLRYKALEPVLCSDSGITQIRAPDGSRFRFASVPAVVGPGYAYRVHVGRNAEAVGSVLDEYLAMYIISVPLILALSVSVGWYLAGRALKPFAEVARTVEQYSSKNLHSPIQTRYTEREVQKLVDAFNQLAGRLNASFSQMSRFNADVAHELRTPLAVLQGETEIALQSPAIPEEIRIVLCSNLEELDRLSRIVKDMLTLAAADAGTQVIAENEIRLVPLVQDLVEQMRILAGDRGIEIKADQLDETLILGDELWIRRALLNLLDNAIKYSRNGGRIELCLRSLESTARITVRDEGIGIAPEDLPRIFDRLYRSDPARSRTTGGTGLGLAFVKWIVEAHKGNILVESLPDCGSVFTVEFPLG
jgi:heavy metal sensor kinase